MSLDDWCLVAQGAMTCLIALAMQVRLQAIVCMGSTAEVISAIPPHVIYKHTALSFVRYSVYVFIQPKNDIDLFPWAVCATMLGLYIIFDKSIAFRYRISIWYIYFESSSKKLIWTIDAQIYQNTRSSLRLGTLVLCVYVLRMLLNHQWLFTAEAASFFSADACS